MTYVGGLRDRLIRDSVWHTVDDALRALGWYVPAASHEPVHFLAEPSSSEVEVPLNTLAMGDLSDIGEPAELGSDLTEFRWDTYVDVYGENDAISMHLAGDVAAILEGRMPSIGRAAPVIPVWDYTLATPVLVFQVEIEGVQRARSHGFTEPWLRFWRTVSFVVVDTYGNEDDPNPDLDFEGYGGY